MARDRHLRNPIWAYFKVCDEDTRTALKLFARRVMKESQEVGARTPKSFNTTNMWRHNDPEENNKLTATVLMRWEC